MHRLCSTLCVACSEFSVNIDPVDVFEVKTRVEVVQLDPPLLLRLQDQLARVQPRFLYHHGLTNNTFQQVTTCVEQPLRVEGGMHAPWQEQHLAACERGSPVPPQDVLQGHQDHDRAQAGTLVSEEY